MRFTVKVSASAGASIAKKLRPLAEQARKIALPKVAALVVDRVNSAADAVLKTSAEEYKRALHMPGAVDVKDNELIIRLLSPAIRALELGGESFDIKAKMLPHAKKFAKSGSPYIDVPFQHALSKNAVHLQGMPQSVQQAMTQAVAKAQSKLVKGGVPKDQAALATVRLPGKTPGRTFERTLTIGGKQFKTTVEHKQGIHDDMIRTAVAGPKKAITKYTTVRRISAASAATAWWHPGFQGKHLFKQVMPAIKTQLEAIIRDAYRSVGLKVRFKK